MEYDFLDELGEGSYYSDEENRTDNNEDHPTDILIDELEEVE